MYDYIPMVRLRVCVPEIYTTQAPDNASGILVRSGSLSRPDLRRRRSIARPAAAFADDFNVPTWQEGTRATTRFPRHAVSQKSTHLRIQVEMQSALRARSLVCLPARRCRACPVMNATTKRISPLKPVAVSAASGSLATTVLGDCRLARRRRRYTRQWRAPAVHFGLNQHKTANVRHW